MVIMLFFSSFISSILYYFSVPWHSLQYASFFCLIPFFLSIEKSNNLKNVILNCLFFSMPLAVLLCTPLFHAGLVNYGKDFTFLFLSTTFLVIIPIVILYCFYGTFHHILKSRFYYLNIVLIPSLWIMIDYIREVFDFFIPWYFIGYSQVGTPFIQFADITGIYGVSFFVVYFNYSITMFLTQKKHAAIVKFFILLISTSLLLLYGIISDKNETLRISPDQNINITGIQGNTGSLDRWNKSRSYITYSKYLELTEKNYKGSDILIWPETVLNSSDKANYELIHRVNSIYNSDTIFIAGGTRKDNRGTFNSVFISKDGVLSYIYDKKILFPYSERKFAGLSHGGVLGSTDTFIPGKKPALFKNEKVNPAISICFESLYPSYIRKSVKEGADILINVSNDSWFGNTYEPYMHFNSTIVRAIENRRSMARVTNSGISALITPSGRITSSLELEKEGAVTGNLTKRKSLTFYTRYGDFIIIISVIIILSAILLYMKEPVKK